MSFVAESKGNARLLEIEIIRETNKAVQIDFEGEEFWLPRSQTSDMSADELTIPTWLAKEKGLL